MHMRNCLESSNNLTSQAKQNRRKMAMDFIEQWFGVSPDGGDGSLELLWLAAIIVAVLAVFFRRRIVAWFAARTSKRG
jgi:hypothetical protein